jgi:fumarate hydratase subunit beta
MDKYTPTFLKELGVSVMIGKGNRGSEVIEAMKNTKAVYFVVIGGLGAKIASCVTKNELIAFPELGAEAIRKLEVVDMPAIVAIDSAGHSIY